MNGAAYWPFWIGGAGLAAVAVLHLLWTRHPLGLSGGLAKLIRFRADERERRAELTLAAGDLDDALLAATLARFGPEALAEVAGPDPEPTAQRDAGAAQSCSLHRGARLPVDCSALFVVSLVVGGALAHWMSSGSPSAATAASAEPGAALSSPLIGFGPGDALRLVAGGLLVGFGARMAGGCTSGHGLSGLASFRPASALATAAMFAGGIAVAFWLER